MNLDNVLIQKEFLFEFLTFCFNYIEIDEFEIRTCSKIIPSVHNYIDGMSVFDDLHRFVYIYNVTKGTCAIKPIDDILSSKLIKNGLGHDVSDAKVTYRPDSPISIKDVIKIMNDNCDSIVYPYIPYLYNVFLKLVYSKANNNSLVICNFTEVDQCYIYTDLVKIKEFHESTIKGFSDNKMTQEEYLFLKERISRDFDKKNKLINEIREEQERIRTRKIKEDPRIISLVDYKQKLDW